MSTSFVATTSTPVPQTSARRTSPIATGAVTTTFSNALQISKIIPFGISSFVLQETMLIFPPFTRTVEVTILVGFVHSFFAYFSPFGQVFPVTSVTSPFSNVTLRLHPIGQPIQINSLVSILMPPPDWASDLPLRADGYITDYYKKD